MEDQDVYVQGRSCSYFLMPSLAKLEIAIPDAISKAPGKKDSKATKPINHLDQMQLH